MIVFPQRGGGGGGGGGGLGALFSFALRHMPEVLSVHLKVIWFSLVQAVSP